MVPELQRALNIYEYSDCYLERPSSALEGQYLFQYGVLNIIIIQYAVWRQVQSLFQNDSST